MAGGAGGFFSFSFSFFQTYLEKKLKSREFLDNLVQFKFQLQLEFNCIYARLYLSDNFTFIPEPEVGQRQDNPQA